MRISDWSSDVCSSDLVRAGGLRGAVERYAKALDAIRQTRAQGIDPMPHQREALDRARDALDAIRPQGSTDLNSAFRNDPELVREAAEGRGHEAVRALQVRSAERRVGEECVSTCSLRWAPYR